MVPGKRYQVFSIKERVDKNEKHSTWIKAGSAFMNRDGSVNVYLDVLPIDGKLHVREPIQEQRASNGSEQQMQMQTTQPANGSPVQQHDQQQHAAHAAEPNTQYGGH